MKRRDRRRRRRWLAFGAGAAIVGLGLWVLVASGVFDQALKELTLPLKHEDVIRQQAAEKGVDAALIAAVIYSESKFSDATSSAGARGLMQITPEAAEEI
jgi:soluble lytic murein transglycosylase